jgi:hypothetical protein
LAGGNRFEGLPGRLRHQEPAGRRQAG